MRIAVVPDTGLSATQLAAITARVDAAEHCHDHGACLLWHRDGALAKFLVGLLPELGQCIKCGTSLNGSRAWFHALADGLMCVEHKRLASSEMSAESRALAASMFRSPVEAFTGEPWPKARGADLRRFVAQLVERHIEKKLLTSIMLEKL